MPAQDQDWYEAEPPLTREIIQDLRRLNFRARSKLVPILLLAALLTGGVAFLIARKVPQYRARIVLGVQEGEVSERHMPLPMADLRAYVTTKLMPAKELDALIEHHDLFPLRHKLGAEYARSELWDIAAVEVYRNYFLYDWDPSVPRSARIGIRVDHPDPDVAYEVARDLAKIIIGGAARERDRVAKAIAEEAQLALAAQRVRVTALEDEVVRLAGATSAAEHAGQHGRAAALRDEGFAVGGSLRRAREELSRVAKASGTQALSAAVYHAGLSLDIDIVQDRRPPPIEPRGYLFAVVTIIVFVIAVIVAALFLGAFDSRIHEVDDISRLGIPVVGQVPGFPGDRVGSLRARGVKRRGVPWSSL